MPVAGEGELLTVATMQPPDSGGQCTRPRPHVGMGDEKAEGRQGRGGNPVVIIGPAHHCMYWSVQIRHGHTRVPH